jgi:16S rRNA (guanine527-N7)-methyltransferase
MRVSRETSPPADLASRFDVPRETLARLTDFVALLLHWNRAINLISRSDEARVWSRHVADALQLVDLIRLPCASGIDLGSGGGFPGLILALVTKIPFSLVEADGRKAAFLREAARETESPVIVHTGRLEHIMIPPAPLVTARALAPLQKLLPMASPFLAPDGIFLFPKGRGADRELTAARQGWNMQVERFPSQVDPSGLILRISEVERA